MSQSTALTGMPSSMAAPWLIKFRTQRKLQQSDMLRCRSPAREVLAFSARGKCRARGQRQSREAVGSREPAVPPRLRLKTLQRCSNIEFGIALAGVNLCGRRPNNTSHFDTIGHAPALGLR